MPSAFISHSSSDDGYVAELESFIRALQFDRVFNDSRSIQPDAQLWPEIERAILDHDVLIVVITRASMNSEWVKQEIAFGDRNGKKVLPIWIEDCDLPARFANRDVIDFRPRSSARSLRVSPSRILRHSPPKLFGRVKWLDALDAAWAKPTLNVYTLVAWGGVGKTSLVAHWVSERLAAKGWPGVERYFDWSFYSQGTGESRQTSSDLFIQKALEFFGDPDPIKGSPRERGERLAGLVRQHRTLLVLDGIEPLQYPVNDPQAGRLKDQALEALVQGLAADNPGLCVVTTREHLKNVENQATAEEQKLDKLPLEAAIALLRHLEIVGTDQEIEAAWKAAGGHALTLQLLGRFIADAYLDRDIRHYMAVRFEDADRETQGRTAFKVMVAYERWLQSAGPERQRELAVLRLTGLFDRPMSHSCLTALRAEPAIPGLTDVLVKLRDTDWNIALKRLTEVDLLTVGSDAVDAHPLIREYFAKQLREGRPAAWQAAHSRLFDHLCAAAPHRPDGLAGLAPLYQAVAHGCLAGRHREACEKVYRERILRGTGADGFYSIRKLGAVGADLAAVAAFFEQPWTTVAPALPEPDRAWLLNQAAYNLRALGRLAEAVAPMRAGLDLRVRQKDWKQAAISASNLSELGLALGRLAEAGADAERAVGFADRSGDPFLRIICRATLADARHQVGGQAAAGDLFAEAERQQAEWQPEYPLLYSLPGFLCCDWVLATAERATWAAVAGRPAPATGDPVAACAEADRRAATTLRWAVENRSPLLGFALDRLTLARSRQYRALLAGPAWHPAPDLPDVAAALAGLRDAGEADFLVRGLLTAALDRWARGEPDTARAALAEAQQIAERGPMPLHLADIYLNRARLFRDRSELDKAAQLVRDLGYGRRFDELADAEEAAKGW